MSSTITVVDHIGKTPEAGSLRSLHGQPGQVVVVQRFWPKSPQGTDDDGGGGLFAWDPVRSFDDGGTVIVPSPRGPGCWRRIGSGPISVRWFGARGNGVQDDLPFIQRAVDVVRGVLPGAVRAGGTVFFPTGTYRCNGSIRVDASTIATEPGWIGIVLDGGGWAALVQSSDHAPLVQGNPALYVTLRGFRLVSGNTAYAGHLVDLQGTAAADSSNNLIEQCSFREGLQPSGALPLSLLRLDRCLYTTVRGCEFAAHAEAGILGRDTAYSNAIAIENCLFYSAFSKGAIYNAGSHWSIARCWFTASSDSHDGTYGATYDQDTQPPMLGATYQLGFFQCRFGEAGAASCGRPWISAHEVRGLTISGCALGNPAGPQPGGPRVVIDGCLGVNLTGNVLVEDGVQIKFQNTHQSASGGIAILGNLFAQGQTPITGWEAIGGGFCAIGNGGMNNTLDPALHLPASPTAPIVTGPRSDPEGALLSLVTTLANLGLVTNATVETSGP